MGLFRTFYETIKFKQLADPKLLEALKNKGPEDTIKFFQTLGKLGVVKDISPDDPLALTKKEKGLLSNKAKFLFKYYDEKRGVKHFWYEIYVYSDEDGLKWVTLESYSMSKELMNLRSLVGVTDNNYKGGKTPFVVSAFHYYYPETGLLLRYNYKPIGKIIKLFSVANIDYKQKLDRLTKEPDKYIEDLKTLFKPFDPDLLSEEVKNRLKSLPAKNDEGATVEMSDERIPIVRDDSDWGYFRWKYCTEKTTDTLISYLFGPEGDGANNVALAKFRNLSDPGIAEKINLKGGLVDPAQTIPTVPSAVNTKGGPLP